MVARSERGRRSKRGKVARTYDDDGIVRSVFMQHQSFAQHRVSHLAQRRRKLQLHLTKHGRRGLKPLGRVERRRGVVGPDLGGFQTERIGDEEVDVRVVLPEAAHAGLDGTAGRAEVRLLFVLFCGRREVWGYDALEHRPDQITRRRLPHRHLSPHLLPGWIRQRVEERNAGRLFCSEDVAEPLSGAPPAPAPSYYHIVLFSVRVSGLG